MGTVKKGNLSTRPAHASNNDQKNSFNIGLQKNTPPGVSFGTSNATAAEKTFGTSTTHFPAFGKSFETQASKNKSLQPQEKNLVTHTSPKSQEPLFVLNDLELITISLDDSTKQQYLKPPSQTIFHSEVKPSGEIDITNKAWKIIIPDEVLKQLRCSFCNNHLSQLPIYMYPNQQIMCGRCPIQGNQSPERLFIYEALAKYFFYPCSYKSNGCIQQFKPTKVPAHEQFCTYKLYPCRSYPPGSCKWKGFCTEVYAHYEAEHKPLILNNNSCSFTVDLTNEHTNNYLLEKNLELFIIHIHCDQQQFRGLVSYFANKRTSQDYFYEFQFKEAGYSLTLNEKKNIDTCSHFDENAFVYFSKQDIKLTNLESALCFVKIIPHLHHGMANLSTAKPTKPTEGMEEKLLTVLKCPCCFDAMFPPIFQCTNGHSICSKCSKRITKCRSCSAHFLVKLRNHTLEEITKHISKYPCKYVNFGCTFVSKPEDKLLHEKSCSYFTYTCPFEFNRNCNWEGIQSDILEHAKIKHEEDIITISTITSMFFDNSKDKEDPDCRIYILLENLFRVMFKYEKKQFFWSVQFVGPANNSTNFMYVLHFGDSSGKEQRWILQHNCSPLTKYTEAFLNADSYICVPFQLLKPFINEDSITYKFNVFAC